MSRTSHARELFADGFNCAQAVFAACAPALGVDRATALRVATGLGGGIGGPVTGGVLTISLLHGRTEPGDRATYELAKRRVREFVERFEQRFGASGCSELLGYDIATPDGASQARRAGRFRQLCPRLVEGAVELLQEGLPEGSL